MKYLSEEALIYRLDRAKDPAMVGFILALIHECKELNEWQPIDEDTPKHKYILLFYPKLKDKIVARWSHHFNCWITNLREDINTGEPSHWQHLQEDPK